MPGDDSLKRLGGGRWETRDGRFAIEPQSGTWVIVDNSQTDELGLPLVRGPFGSLTAAREAIEAARTAGTAESPLAERIRQAKALDGRTPGKGDSPAATKARKTAKSDERDEPEEPDSPPEPKWLRDLEPGDRRRGRELVDRLEKLGVDDSEEIARAEIARDRPAMTRLALERSLAKISASSDEARDAVRATIKVIVSGKDSELGVRWRLVDDRGRRIDELEIPD